MRIIVFFIFVLLVWSFQRTHSSTGPLTAEMTENIILSYGAYCQADDIFNWSCYYCNITQHIYGEPFVSQETMKHAFFYSVIRDETTLVMVYRGTLNPFYEGVAAIINWIYNILFYLVKLPYAPKGEGIKVHAGFLSVYTSLRNESFQRMEEVVEKFPKVDKILFTGHSLGSTIGMLTMLDLVVTTENKRLREIVDNNGVGLMTFGSPRVGNKKFHDYFAKIFDKSNNYRLVNQRDPITTQPIHAMGYWHTPYEYFFQNDTEHYKKCDGSGEDPSCGDIYFHDVPSDHHKYLGVDASHCN